ncbi:hypothetical protein FQN50_009939 [Emmonsiellopsis sp. PD_5]|nr:hypothetical protein FQN50_009939 [Emmonsiellopsis sp. PD_5]
MPCPDNLPSTPHQWEARVAKKKLGNNPSIHMANILLNSASAIEEDQYLRLRVLWRALPLERFNWKKFHLEEWRTAGKNLLASYQSWGIYCKDLSTSLRTISQSSFALARLLQLQVAHITPDSAPTPSVVISPTTGRQLERRFRHLQLQTPTKSTGRPLPTNSDSEEEEGGGEEEIDDLESPLVSRSPIPAEIRNLMYQQTKDEQIVNTALVNFLSALTLHSRLPNQWTIHRKSFIATFNHTSFEARTDGYLEDTKHNAKIRALIEVKAALRERKREEICMQEAAQMVAWIQSHPDRDGQLSLPGR